MLTVLGASFVSRLHVRPMLLLWASISSAATRCLAYIPMGWSDELSERFAPSFLTGAFLILLIITQMESHGSTTLPASNTTEGKRLRRACNGCHRMKLRCSGTKPCAHCQDTGNDCAYAFVAKLGKPRGSRNKKTIERERERQRQVSAAASEQGEGNGEAEPDTRSSSPASTPPPPSTVQRKLTDSGNYSGNSCVSNSGPDTVDGMDWTALVHAAVTTPASLPIDPALGWMDEMDGLDGESCLQSTMCDVS
jgi:hypothetical protein